MNYRIVTTLVLLLSIFVLPYWIYLPAILASIIVLPFYWESLIFTIFIDMVYGPGVGWSVSALAQTYSFWALIVLIIFLPVRERLRVYD